MKYDYANYDGFSVGDRSILKDPRGVQRTETLFHGMNKREEKYPSIYSLADEERKGLPSIYQIYMWFLRCSGQLFLGCQYIQR